MTAKAPREPLEPPRAWCYTPSCMCLTVMRRPSPVKVVGGTSIREGTCAACGEPVWRVGGGKAEGVTES